MYYVREYKRFSSIFILGIRRVEFCGYPNALLSQGVIQSPEYPQAYTANVDCLWLLETANFQDRIYLDCDSVELGKYYSRITILDHSSEIRGLRST